MTNEHRFLGKADVYSRYRPSYPTELIDYLCTFFDAELNPYETITIADIGAGTGLFTQLLLKRGFRVIAIEPNQDMLSKLSVLQEQYPSRLDIKAASAEYTGLAPASVDMIVCAQAFHWVDETKAKKEWSRILKPMGQVALIWNQRSIDANDFMRSYERLFLGLDATNHTASYSSVGHQYVNREALKSFYGELPQMYRISYLQPLDEVGFIGRVMSSSYAPKENDSRYNTFLEQSKQVYYTYKNEQTGTVTMLYDTVCYIQCFTA